MDQIYFLNEKKTQLVYSNFKYHHDCKLRKDGSRFYRCVDYKEYRCPATLIINVEVFTKKHEHNHLPMFPIAAEYLISVERLKQSIVTCLTITNIEIKRQYDQIYTQLDTKYSRELINPHWKSRAEVRVTLTRLNKKNSKLKRIMIITKYKLISVK